MKHILLTFIIFKSILTSGQTRELIVDSLVLHEGGLGSQNRITITKNIYKRKTLDLISGDTDTLIILDNRKVDLLNKQLEKLRKVEFKDRTRKLNHSCPSYSNLVLYKLNTERDLGRYTTEKPPRIFKKLDEIINKIELRSNGSIAYTY